MIVVASVALVGLLAFALGWLSVWATPLDKDRAAAVNATRQTFLAATAGLVAVAGLVTGARTYLLSREGQLTDRYANAVALVASDKAAERIGGIYALERLLTESVRDHDMIVEVLAAYIRQTAPAVASAAVPPGDRHAVQAALTVIGRRPFRTEANDLNLAHTDLRGMVLVSARLRHADLRGCRLENVNLTLADCRDTVVVGADLRGALLVSTDLRGADLTSAMLFDADVSGARMDEADLLGTRMGGAADQRDIRSLTVTQLHKAKVDASTELPVSLRETG